MDDFKIIFWIILGLIYLFARKKKKEPPRTPGRTIETDEEAATPSSKGPKTFEELLEEIQGMKSPGRLPPPVAANDRPPVGREPEYINYDDELKEEKKDLEELPYGVSKEDSIYQTYEEAKNQAFARPSLEETLKLEDTIVRFKQFKGYEKETKQNIAGYFLKDFKDPRGFRRAFIMSEILKRKF